MVDVKRSEHERCDACVTSRTIALLHQPPTVRLDLAPQTVHNSSAESYLARPRHREDSTVAFLY
jgi:hypothetical protein